MNIKDIIGKCSGNVQIIRNFDVDYVLLLGKEKKTIGRSLSYLINDRYLDQLIKAGITSVICPYDILEVVEKNFTGGICVSDDPKTTFFQIHELLHLSKVSQQKSTVNSTAVVDPTVFISENNVKIGKNVRIERNCVIKDNVTIEDDTHIEEGCIIGTPAFYYYGDNETKRLVNSTGGVHIGKNVGIHSNVVIEKGVFDGYTTIEDNCAIDNFVLIEHDCQVGQNCIIAGKVTLAGGIKVGKNCYLGVGSTVSHNIAIGDNVKLSVGSAVTRDIPSDSEYAGNYAIEHDKFIKHLKTIC